MPSGTKEPVRVAGYSVISALGNSRGEHLDKLYQMIDRVCQREEHTAAIVQTAKVVARLYLLQLEEVDNE